MLCCVFRLSTEALGWFGWHFTPEFFLVRPSSCTLFVRQDHKYALANCKRRRSNTAHVSQLVSLAFVVHYYARMICTNSSLLCPCDNWWYLCTVVEHADAFEMFITALYKWFYIAFILVHIRKGWPWYHRVVPSVWSSLWSHRPGTGGASQQVEELAIFDRLFAVSCSVKNQNMYRRRA